MHGRYFAAEFYGTKVVGRISVNEYGWMYLCQDTIPGGTLCRDFLGYNFALFIDEKILSLGIVTNLTILPSPDKYHELFQEILANRGPVWEEDDRYSVIPNEVMQKIADFMSSLEKIELK